MNGPSLLSDEDRIATAIALLGLAEKYLAKSDPVQAAKLLSQVEEIATSIAVETAVATLQTNGTRLYCYYEAAAYRRCLSRQHPQPKLLRALANVAGCPCSSVRGTAARS